MLHASLEPAEEGDHDAPREETGAKWHCRAERAKENPCTDPVCYPTRERQRSAWQVPVSPGTAVRVTLGAAVLTLSGVHIGCGQVLGDVAEQATPGVVAGTVEGLADPALQREAIAGLDQDRVQLASAKFSAGILDGMLDAVEDPRRRMRLDALVNDVVSRAAGGATDAVLARLLDEQVQRQTRGAARALVVDLVGTLAAFFESSDWTRADAIKVLGAAAHQIAKQTTLGFQEALDATRRARASGKAPEGDGALLIAANNAAKKANGLLWAVGLGLGAVVIGLGLVLLWAIRKGRLRRAELAQRDDALAMLTKAINEVGLAKEAGTNGLAAVLERATDEHASGAEICEALRKHGHLNDSLEHETAAIRR